MQLQSKVNNYIFIIGYDGHSENDKEVLHVVDNEKDLATVKRWFVDYKIVKESAAKEHIKRSRKIDNCYEIADLYYADAEVRNRKHTKFEIIFSATKNKIRFIDSVQGET